MRCNAVSSRRVLVKQLKWSITPSYVLIRCYIFCCQKNDKVGWIYYVFQPVSSIFNNFMVSRIFVGFSFLLGWDSLCINNVPVSFLLLWIGTCSRLMPLFMYCMLLAPHDFASWWIFLFSCQFVCFTCSFGICLHILGMINCWSLWTYWSLWR